MKLLRFLLLLIFSFSSLSYGDPLTDKLSKESFSQKISEYVNDTKAIFDRHVLSEKGPYETTEEYTKRTAKTTGVLESRLLNYYSSIKNDLLCIEIPVDEVRYNADTETAFLMIPGVSIPYTTEISPDKGEQKIVPQILCYIGDSMYFDGQLKFEQETSQVQIKRDKARKIDIIKNKGILELSFKIGYGTTWYYQEPGANKTEQKLFPRLNLLASRWMVDSDVIWEKKNSQRLWAPYTGISPAKFGEYQIILPTPEDKETILPKLSVTNSLDMDFIYIPPGSFLMGSPKDELNRDDTELRHNVTLTKGFYIQTTEVTQAQWYNIMKTNPSKHSTCGGNCPVSNVSWLMVQKFITKLNTIEKDKTYRLPTEAEWEYSARANNTQAYCFGNQAEGLADYGWYIENSGELLQEVAQKKPNDYGLYDMHGNVWEWCSDWIREYPPGSVTDPAGKKSGWEKVLRGGSYKNKAEKCRSASRFKNHTGSTMPNYGFRLVFSPVNK